MRVVHIAYQQLRRYGETRVAYWGLEDDVTDDDEEDFDDSDDDVDAEDDSVPEDSEAGGDSED